MPNFFPQSPTVISFPSSPRRLWISYTRATRCPDRYTARLSRSTRSRIIRFENSPVARECVPARARANTSPVNARRHKSRSAAICSRPARVFRLIFQFQPKDAPGKTRRPLPAGRGKTAPPRAATVRSHDGRAPRFASLSPRSFFFPLHRFRKRRFYQGRCSLPAGAVN